MTKRTPPRWRHPDGYMWEGIDGALHFDVPRFLRVAGYTDTPANRDTAAEVLAQLARELWPRVQVSEQ